MAQPYVPGACAIWVMTQTQPVFLGYSDRGVSINITPRYSPYLTDQCGEEAMDWEYVGSTATVTALIPWWSEDAYASISNYAGSTAGRGRDVPGSIGTWMNLEGKAHVLYLVFAYGSASLAAKPIYSAAPLPAGPMPAGYRWPCAMLDRDSLPHRGNSPAKLHLTWRCFRQVNAPAAGQAVPPGQAPPLPNSTPDLLLYDHDLSALANMPTPL